MVVSTRFVHDGSARIVAHRRPTHHVRAHHARIAAIGSAAIALRLRPALAGRRLVHRHHVLRAGGELDLPS